MRTTPIRTAVALATTLMFSSPSVFASVLGDVVSLSPIGEPLRAEIRIVGGFDQETANCLRIGTAGDDAGDLPWVAGARLSVIGGASPRVAVTTSRAINEPVVRVALEDVCENRLRREYTLLLPYPVSKPAAPTSPVQQTSRPAPAKSTPSTGRTWTTAPGESLDSLAHSLYPDDAAARRRFIRATAAANPGLFEQAGSQALPLPAGTTLAVPDLRTLSSGAPAKRTDKPRAAQAQTPAASRPPGPAAGTPAVAAAQPPRSDTRDRVIVESDKPTAAPAGAAATASGEAPGSRASELLERERKLAAAIDRSIIAEMELLARIKELEEARDRLQARIEALDQAAMQASAPAVPAATSPGTPEDAPASSPDHRDTYLIAGLAIAALALAMALRRRRPTSPGLATATAPTARDDQPPAPAQPASPVHERNAVAVDAPTPQASPRRYDEGIDWSTSTLLPIGGYAVDHPSDDAGEEHRSAVELAEIMVSFGRLHGAADTLAEFIRGNPKQAVTPWLKLLEVYRAAGLREDFGAVARELNKTFNVLAVTWDNYDAIRHNAIQLEDIPHIATRVQQLWGTRECQAYLQHLLRDNRDGSRAGFPFTVIDDILMLSAVLEQELGTYRAAPTQA
ncbi:Type 4 pilus biogenesis [Thauera humireducens]|uniref:type IV pilus assembly protein FimV n=1 Tax=Thauera humireducens TaxID=1134435 RepID=UPI002467AADE|nr:hypothetical protein [Thauera humireducens]CAH1745749.1 Type 4 pilus biogenesis [Thauera humireducens]